MNPEDEEQKKLMEKRQMVLEEVRNGRPWTA